MKHYVKYKNWWWEYDPSLPKTNTNLINSYGGINSGVDISGLETATAENKSGLNWYGTEAYDIKYKTGWLSPNGKFFGCDYRNHASQAKYVHGKSENELENEGWVKISYTIYYNKNRTRDLEAIFGAKDYSVYPSREQLEYIKAHYTGKDRDNMYGYLVRTRMIRTKEIKKDWDLEKY